MAKKSSFEKLDSRAPQDTMAYRDVFEDQQLERAEAGTPLSATVGTVLSWTAGAVVAILVWIVVSLVMVVIGAIGSMSLPGPESESQSGMPEQYYVAEERTREMQTYTCYRAVAEDGSVERLSPCVDDPSQVEVPEWWIDPADREVVPEETPAEPVDGPEEDRRTVSEEFTHFSFIKFYLSAGAGLLVALVLAGWNGRRVKKHNAHVDHSDINDHRNDQHIATPDEILRKFEVFPDAGVHSGVEVNSMISHAMLQAKGLKSVEVTQFAEKDMVDEKGEIAFYKGEELVDDAGRLVTKTLPVIDEAFGAALFEASGVPEDKTLRRTFDARTIPYNPDGKNREKSGKHNTVADLIEKDWELPDYERQRPAGVYMVDSAPVNTMVLAITRAGKGQTYIEPVLDMWSREKNPSNMVVNDPKGELLVKNYVSLVKRGFHPVQFNLINPLKTDVYNPMWLAAEAAREKDATKCAMYVENIADVFFPLDGGEDPVWPNAANNAFKRAVYGMIDYYLEQERELRMVAAATDMDAETLEQKLDEMWGKATLYNCYQFFVQLTSKKMKSPVTELEQAVKAGKYEDREEELLAEQERVDRLKFLWEDKPELDMLSLYFNATEALPRNSMRTLVNNSHNALRAIAGAEKMLASVYGITITAMSFFTDPTISTLTSGKPSQNVDLGGLSFPRRFGVRLAANYLKRDNLVGLQAVWSAYSDPMFSQSLGADFDHEDIVGREGWARYYFKGIFEAEEAWIKLELRNPQTGLLVRTFWFKFTKGYRLSPNGRHYVRETVTNRKLVDDGVLREMVPVREGGTKDGKILSFKAGHSTYKQEKLDLASSISPEVVWRDVQVIAQTAVRYSELPKAVFLVTPPHLMSYAKLILILIKQLVDLNFDKSYMTKSDQKPLYRTRFMLDELGNLQSEGHGISGFETMLSIGLGQQQQFTIVLQTLQQLRDVYGDSVDRIVQGNTSNIVFLKSTDDSMIETLEKMSGTTHRTRASSKQITQNLDKVVGGETDGSISLTYSTGEEPLISYNDMAFISERNSIVFRAGDAPVWNRNETILPMSWRLRQGGLVHPGHDYSLQTIPTMSDAISFDVRMNQPDFKEMLAKRIREAAEAESAKERYKTYYGGLEDIDVERLDPDVYSDEVMELITQALLSADGKNPNAPTVMDLDEMARADLLDDELFVDNTLVQEETAARMAEKQQAAVKVFAEGKISRDMLVDPQTKAAKVKGLDSELAEVYGRLRTELERDHEHFSVGGAGELRSADGSQVYVEVAEAARAHGESLERLRDQSTSAGARVFSEGEVDEHDLRALNTVTIHAAFYHYLASLPSWLTIAGGQFDQQMAVEMRAAEA